MYTAFNQNGTMKRDRLGLVVFVRTLAKAKEACLRPGDYVIGWSNSGSARAHWVYMPTGRFKRFT